MNIYTVQDRTNLHKLFAAFAVVGAPYTQRSLNTNNGGRILVILFTAQADICFSYYYSVLICLPLRN